MIFCGSVTPEVANLLLYNLGQSGIKFIGLQGEDVYRAVITDALVEKNVSIIVAQDGVDLIGWTIAVIDSRNYWKRFLLRHPILAAKAATTRLLAIYSSPITPRKLPQTSKYSWQRSIDRKWGGASPTIARHLNITVLERYRQGGVATMLQNMQIKELRSKGVRRIDAYIHVTNKPSIAFHKKKGWALVKEENSMLQITMDI